LYFRINEMKLLLGDPGKPDGWIPPAQVVDIDADSVLALFDSHDMPEGDLLCSSDLHFYGHVRLFNLTIDPYEKKNIASENKDIVKGIFARLAKYLKTMIKPDIAPEEKAGNPNENGGFFGPGWCAAEPATVDNEIQFYP
jgi:hypothetical protein